MLKQITCGRKDFGFGSQLIKKIKKKKTHATTLLKEQKANVKKKRFYLFIRVAMLHKHIYSSLWLFFFHGTKFSSSLFYFKIKRCNIFIEKEKQRI
jgi:hypothetical protein